MYHGIDNSDEERDDDDFLQINMANLHICSGPSSINQSHNSGEAVSVDTNQWIQSGPLQDEVKIEEEVLISFHVNSNCVPHLWK